MDGKINIIHGDSLDAMNDSESVIYDLIITSPPYNLQKEYEKKKSLEEYKNWLKPFIQQFYRLLKEEGSICFQVGNYIDTGKVYPLDCILFNMFIETGFIPRNRIIWTFGHGLHCKNRLSGRHETILWFTKSDQYTFNLDPIRVPQKYPSKKYFKGIKKGQLSCNPLGKNPSDIWDISNVKNNHPEKTDHPCQFPEELVRRCVLMLTNENGNVLDPFGGSGTTAKVCNDTNRNCVIIEKELNYINIIKERVR